MPRLNSREELDRLRREILARRDPGQRCIATCAGTGCLASGAADVVEAFRRELAARGLTDKIALRGTGCHGFCEKGPIVVLDPEEICCLQVTPADVPELVERTVLGGEVIDRLLYVDPQTGGKTIREPDIPFYKHQQRLVFGANRKLDPRRIEDYLALGGYRALVKALFERTPEQVIAEVKASKLRGRGGAGFPTGVKWEFARRAAGEPKYVVVNCDEGDPGAYMDRSVLEGNPFRVIEGMMIGALAIGAREGYIYVRDEYPLAVRHVTLALEQLYKAGLLGEKILKTDFSFDLHIAKGAGAFVCGEETALIASIEGRVGEPRQRPPFPAQKGLWKKPTCINNVETWANIPLIILNGADWFSSIGTSGSKGTKIFSLVGKINNTGLVEVPMGITLREIIYDIGGGIPEGKAFKAVQTGGPSGGCLPASMLDQIIDYESLTAAGSIMGSGGMIVMDEKTCMVDVAMYFLNFLRDESCGKCISCRESTQRMWEIVKDITEGQGKPGDLELLEELALATKEASMCGLGQTAANPVLSTLRYFREEFEAHIYEKRCPAGVCKSLIRYAVIPEKCTGCEACKRACPTGAIQGTRKDTHLILYDKCIKCGACLEACRFEAIEAQREEAITIVREVKP